MQHGNTPQAMKFRPAQARLASDAVSCTSCGHASYACECMLSRCVSLLLLQNEMARVSVRHQKVANTQHTSMV